MQNFVFGDIGFKIFVWKNISSHTHAFLVLNFNALSQINLFFKIVFFQKNLVSLCLIQSVHSVFRPIEIFKILNFLREGAFVCFDWSRLIFDRSKLVFLVFLKRQNWTFSNSLFKLFQVPLSLRVGSWLHHQFLSFSFKIFARFLSLEAGKTLLPFFFKFISCFHAF